VITDVFSLADVPADELRWTEQPWRRWPCLRATDIGPRELARLGEALGLGPYDDVLASFSFLAGESQESPWVVGIPTGLTRRLVELGGAEIECLGARWQDGRDGETGPTAAPGSGYLAELQRFLSRDDGPYALYIEANTIAHDEGGGP
jgi:hypothetical protein